MPTRRADFVEVQRFAALPAKHLLFKPAIKKHLKRPTVTAALEETISRLVRLTVCHVAAAALGVKRHQPHLRAMGPARMNKGRHEDGGSRDG